MNSHRDLRRILGRIDVPGPDERASLNAALHANDTETGFWDEHGVPAPWPDDIDEWKPVTSPSTTPDPGHQPF